MQFGLFTHLPWPEDTVLRRLIEEITEQVQYGEALGFQGAWFAEHHFSRYGLGSSSLVLLGALAAQTRTIRLGTAVLVPTLHNPIRLAEDIAMVDVASATGASMSVLGAAAPGTSTTAMASTAMRVSNAFRKVSA